MNTKTTLLLLLPLLLLCSSVKNTVEPYRCENGKVSIRSEATLEIVQARSSKLRGYVDPTNHTFAWSVETQSFEGFNSPLQREHFNENYMESSKYPRVSFTGKIIEKIDFQKDGKYTVRAKGKLIAHGVEQERIIRSELEVSGGKIRIRARFSVALSDHNISIPQIVHQKIAEEVTVSIDAELTGGTSQG